MLVLLGWIFVFGSYLVMGQNYQNVSLKASINQVNPMIGLVFWNDNVFDPSSAYALEYFYLPVNKLVVGRVNEVLQYNWAYIDNQLNDIASRGHQAIFRLRYEYYYDEPTAVPAFLKNISGYKGQVYKGIEFMDWRSSDLMQMHLDMYSALANRYDNDNRIFAIQTGFGFWSEYHLSDGPPLQLGYNFPSADFQVQSIKHILSAFKTMPIQYSIDIADNENNWCPLFKNISILPFGSFDDSSFSNDYKAWNDGNKGRLDWKTTRFQQNPLGGEIAYVDKVQQHALDINGPEGQSLPDYVKEYKYTFLIASDQNTYKYDGPLTQVERIKQVGMTFGYKFTITSFQTNGTHTKVTVQNTGVAPPYKDMFLQVSSVKDTTTLKYLQPSASLTVVVKVATTTPTLQIVSPYITSKQKIQFEANL
uniref:DUF4832 domain-containing protein n=1 Tax=Acrobeloides nanus TaxID=290746 RepID=A0A914DXP6_9BILA